MIYHISSNKSQVSKKCHPITRVKPLGVQSAKKKKGYTSRHEFVGIKKRRKVSIGLCSYSNHCPWRTEDIGNLLFWGTFGQKNQYNFLLNFFLEILTICYIGSLWPYLGILKKCNRTDGTFFWCTNFCMY